MDPYPSRPQLLVDISDPCPDWRARFPELEAICRESAAATLAAAAPDLGAAELSLLLADDETVRVLNRDWRGQDRPTNVLSFPSGAPESADAPYLLGDVALAYGTVAAEAAAQGKSPGAHLRHLLVHGVLHLLGFDHEEEEAAARMEALETSILAGLGVADPYAAQAAPVRAGTGTAR